MAAVNHKIISTDTDYMLYPDESDTSEAKNLFIIWYDGGDPLSDCRWISLCATHMSLLQKEYNSHYLIWMDRFAG